jgi:hypothetical protein
MRNFRETTTSADADVRRALANYQAIRRRVKQLDRGEPDADEPADIHEGFERLSKATVRAKQKLFLFNDSRNDSIGGRAIEPFPFWPTYEEWLESGRGDLWKTDRT